MTAKFTTRPFIGLLLILCLWPQIVAVAAPARDHNGSAELSVFALPSSTVALPHGSSRYDDARHRPSASFLSTLVPRHDRERDRGRLLAAIECRVSPSLLIAGPRTGRSPPVIS